MEVFEERAEIRLFGIIVIAAVLGMIAVVGWAIAYDAAAGIPGDLIFPQGD